MLEDSRVPTAEEQNDPRQLSLETKPKKVRPPPPNRRKPDTQISERYLLWPKGQDRCAPELRIRGQCKRKPPRGHTSAVEAAKKTFLTFCKRAGISRVLFTVGFATDEEAMNEKFEEPGVAIYYRWGLKDHYVCCESYTTGLMNLKACTEHIEGTYKVTRHQRIGTDFVRRESFREHRLVKVPKAKAPSKKGLIPEADWAEILEIKPEELDWKNNLPFDRSLASRQHNKLALIYHPDKETSPDEESMMLIALALEKVIELYEIHDERSDFERNQIVEARENAARRVAWKARKAEAEKQKQAVVVGAEEDEDWSELSCDELEPSDEDLRSIEEEEAEDEDDVDQTEDYENEDYYHSGPALFDDVEEDSYDDEWDEDDEE